MNIKMKLNYLVEFGNLLLNILIYLQPIFRYPLEIPPCFYLIIFSYWPSHQQISCPHHPVYRSGAFLWAEEKVLKLLVCRKESLKEQDTKFIKSILFSVTLANYCYVRKFSSLWFYFLLKILFKPNGKKKILQVNI